MSLLMVTEEHLEMMLNGEKTQTRRQWDSPRLKIGNSYRVVRSDVPGSLFTPRDEAPAYITVEDIWEEPLDAISEEDANKEGGYTKTEFKDRWKEINGNWNPDETVWVVKFKTHETDPRTT
jgi:hypothetical protein